MSEWKQPEYVQPDTLVLVHGAGRMKWGVAKYTHARGWIAQDAFGNWESMQVPKLWQPLPASPGQEGV